MNIEFKINFDDLISDMFHDESNDIEDALKGEIIRNVINNLLPLMQKSIDKQIGERIESVINDRVTKRIDKALNDAIDSGVIMVRGQKTSIELYLQDVFVTNTGWGSVTEKMAKMAKVFGNELKLKYNTVFASKIVESMKDQGLLKDDVVKILLEDKK